MWNRVYMFVCTLLFAVLCILRFHLLLPFGFFAFLIQLICLFFFSPAPFADLDCPKALSLVVVGRGVVGRHDGPAGGGHLAPAPRSRGVPEYPEARTIAGMVRTEPTNK